MVSVLMRLVLSSLVVPIDCIHFNDAITAKEVANQVWLTAEQDSFKDKLRREDHFEDPDLLNAVVVSEMFTIYHVLLDKLDGSLLEEADWVAIVLPLGGKVVFNEQRDYRHQRQILYQWRKD